jgi:hypothetical protein
VAIDQARIERQIRELALDHAAGRLEDAAYLGRLHGLRDAKENVERTSADGITAERAVAWLRALSETWRAAEVPAERADLLHAVYDRITVAGRRIVSVRLTPSAYGHRFALALPEKVVLARPPVLSGWDSAGAVNRREAPGVDQSGPSPETRRGSSMIFARSAASRASRARVLPSFERAAASAR